MFIARIDGTVVSTLHHPSLTGFRAVICQPIDESGRESGDPVIAIDPLGAALHQHAVVSTDGSAARELVKNPRSPLRNFVVGIVDPPL
jgi:microcompartment protein CcmK/EutM